MRVIFVLLVIIAIAWAFYPSWMPPKEYTFLVNSEEDTELIEKVAKSKNWDVNFLIFDKEKQNEDEAVGTDNDKLSLNNDIITFTDQWIAIVGKDLGTKRLNVIDSSIPDHVIDTINEAINKKDYLKVLDVLNQDIFNHDNIELSAEIDFQKCLFEYQICNSSKALNLCGLAVEKAPNVDLYLFGLASMMIENNQYDKAIELYNRLLSVVSSYKDKNKKIVMEIRINEDLALLYRDIGAFSEAVQTIMQIIDQRKKLYEVNDYSIGRQYYQLAVNFFMLGDYDESINHAYEALNIIHNEGEKVNGDSASTYVLLAKNNNAMGNNDAATEFIKTASNHFDGPEVSNPKGLANYYEIIAQLYFTQAEYLQAYEFCAKAYSVYANEIPKDLDVVYVLCDIAKYSAHLGKYELALKCIQEAKESTIGPGLNWRHYFEIYNSLGEIKYINDEFNHALNNYKKAIQLADENGYTVNHNLINIYLNISTIYSKLGNKELSSEYVAKSYNLAKIVFGMYNFRTLEIKSKLDM